MCQQKTLGWIKGTGSVTLLSCISCSVSDRPTLPRKRARLPWVKDELTFTLKPVLLVAIYTQRSVKAAVYPPCSATLVQLDVAGRKRRLFRQRAQREDSCGLNPAS